MTATDRQNSFELMRKHLLAKHGKEYWRSLDELVETDEFREFVSREYPQHAEHWDDPIGRRSFIKLMGASLALAGLSSCVYQPTEKIVPFVRDPEGIIPGKPLFYATAMTLGGFATGLLAKSNDGRPTKIEGNELHPASLGATDVFAQASILSLYDPDRSQTITHRGEIRPWAAFLGEMFGEVERQKPKQGAGLRILTETITSPTLARQIREILTDLPQARWHQYEPANRSNCFNGAIAAFGSPVNTIYRFDRSERILSIDADFLSSGPGWLRYARDFSNKRRVTSTEDSMNRLYVVESTPSSTGAVADHRWPLRPSEIEGFTRAIAAALGVQVPATGAVLTSISSETITAIANDLRQHSGRSLVLAGPEQPPLIHAIVHALNQSLGNAGQTVVYTSPVEASPVDQIASLRELLQDIDNGQVDILLMVGGNPVYDAPADLQFKERFVRAGLRIHLSLYNDETSELCHWHVPETHFLESWSDSRAYDGAVTLGQPLIAPLYRGKSAYEVLAAFSAQPERTTQDVIRTYWKNRFQAGQISGSMDVQAATTSPTSALTPSPEFEGFWRKAIHDGFIADTAAQETSPTMRADWSRLQSPSGTSGDNEFEIVFRADPTVYDGRFSNNGWLQECPKTFTKITWDNVAMISPATAAARGLTDKTGWKGGERIVDVIELSLDGRSVRAPIWITPGQADNCVTVHLGYGRSKAGRVGSGVGFNSYAIRTSEAFWSGRGVQISSAGETYQIATTQLHHLMENRELVRSSTIDGFRENPKFAQEAEHEPAADESLYPEFKYEGYAWGMAIDLGSCVGCNACVVACQSENNIPIVGKDEVIRSREMHWLRIDSYHKGDLSNPETHFQPVLCMHCEKAPCEPVCPVHATVHSAEGLNDMIYNRCVGTRYCSNNCPYKVRRFNFLLYQDFETPTYKLMRNPEVTVRSRGVMEKCTYCVQRIQDAKIESEKEGRSVRDGEIVTACQQACPTEAIVFGNINDPNSRVARLKSQERNYSLLGDLNTRPRTTYIASLRNPNPEVKGLEDA